MATDRVARGREGADPNTRSQRLRKTSPSARWSTSTSCAGVTEIGDYQSSSRRSGRISGRAGWRGFHSPRHAVHRGLRILDLREGDDLFPQHLSSRRVVPAICATQRLPTQRLRPCVPNGTFRTRSQTVRRRLIAALVSTPPRWAAAAQSPQTHAPYSRRSKISRSAYLRDGLLVRRCPVRLFLGHAGDCNTPPCPFTSWRN